MREEMETRDERMIEFIKEQKTLGRFGTYKELAERAGMSSVTVSNVMKGKQSMSKRFVEKIKDVFRDADFTWVDNGGSEFDEINNEIMKFKERMEKIGSKYDHTIHAKVEYSLASSMEFTS